MLDGGGRLVVLSLGGSERSLDECNGARRLIVRVGVYPVAVLA